jgi:hypothetical protein
MRVLTDRRSRFTLDHGTSGNLSSLRLITKNLQIHEVRRTSRVRTRTPFPDLMIIRDPHSSRIDLVDLTSKQNEFFLLRTELAVPSELWHSKWFRPPVHGLRYFETWRFLEISPAHTLCSSSLRLFQHLTKCWPFACLARVFLSFYTQMSICALFALTLEASRYLSWATESENDSAFTLLAWLLYIPCTSVSKEKQLKLIEH